MGIERYIAVIHPLRYYSVVTLKRSCIAIVVVWVFGFTLSSFSFALTNEELPNLWIVCWVLTGFAPMLVIFVCYGKIFQAARHQSRKIAVKEHSVRWAISRDGEGAATNTETALKGPGRQLGGFHCCCCSSCSFHTSERCQHLADFHD